MYKKIDFNEEIQRLKKLDVCAFSGRRNTHLTVTVETSQGMENIEYYFSSHNEYSKFLKELRRMC